MNWKVAAAAAACLAFTAMRPASAQHAWGYRPGAAAER